MNIVDTLREVSGDRRIGDYFFYLIQIDRVTLDLGDLFSFLETRA